VSLFCLPIKSDVLQQCFQWCLQETFVTDICYLLNLPGYLLFCFFTLSLLTLQTQFLYYHHSVFTLCIMHPRSVYALLLFFVLPSISKIVSNQIKVDLVVYTIIC